MFRAWGLGFWGRGLCLQTVGELRAAGSVCKSGAQRQSHVEAYVSSNMTPVVEE